MAITGYPSMTSVAPGGLIDFHLSSNSLGVQHMALPRSANVVGIGRLYTWCFSGALRAEIHAETTSRAKRQTSFARRVVIIGYRGSCSGGATCL